MKDLEITWVDGVSQTMLDSGGKAMDVTVIVSNPSDRWELTIKAPNHWTLHGIVEGIKNGCGAAGIIPAKIEFIKASVTILN
ncbi:MAG: hypothetical protein J7577_13385 [Sphingobacteriaceae bacterium]|nr:hypothetical protein [Sphingobacteriaceae bacterium]